ncbi:glycoside hydrolase family 2 TIM barrel-domain containing protein [Eisenbergiella tayi]|uniref:Beta-galactosidase n=1 Tax=Eisenbergiella tayi TaxID=1432052 RepID=A0A1E3AB60_9FIRM|nr:glycoside hydrolase family 2 TIM barrel-domain containing protein [Eisenbergiella tayi]ODM05968.1 Beta-galactosidase [Eisenbergiella tayi]
MYLTGKDVRQKETFNLNWFFYLGEEEKTPGDKDTAGYRPVKLPHDWSLEYPFDEAARSCGSGGYVRTGTGWYKKIFRVNPDAVKDGRAVLHFEGAYMLAQVWLNGQSLGRHVYGYTPFEWDITDLLKTDGSENVVDVKVDNSAQPNSRWYSGSGITRNVWICGMKDIHVAPYGVWIRQPEVSEEQAQIHMETRVGVNHRNRASYEGTAPEENDEITVETGIYAPDGSLCMQERTAQSQQIAAGVREELLFCQDFLLESPVLWDTENPALYKAVTKIYKDGLLLDEVCTVTGFRNVRFDSTQGFLLNGVRVKLNGVCVHHDGGCAGAAVHPQIWERRLEKLKAMGVNAVRMSHNPPDPALLDLCDRMGLMVMDEAFDEWRIMKGKELGSNTHESRGYSEWFDSCHEEDMRLMLLRDRNHPSIIIWSIGNEVPDQTVPEGYLTARHLKSICRELDPERLVTQANDQICAEPRAAAEEFLNELDVVGYNYVDRWRTRAETLYDDDKRAHPDWCVIGTENGSLGGVRGEYLLDMKEKAGWWKMPYYSAPVKIGKLLHFTMTHDYVAGDFMWTGVDYLGEAHWPARSSSAGVLDTCGFEKDSYYFYQSIWKRPEPMAHLLPHWNLEVEEGTIIPVLGYTSCESAELFLNGKSYGRKAYAYPAYGMTERYGHFDKAPVPVNTDDLFLSWDVPYIPGCVELVGYIDGREAVRHTVRTAGEPAAVKLHCYRSEMKGDGLDIAQIEAEILDEHGNLCVQADTKLTFSVQGPGYAAAVDNGNSEGMESMKGSCIHAFHGRALVIIQSDETEKGDTCTVCAEAEGLPGASVTLSIIS